MINNTAYLLGIAEREVDPILTDWTDPGQDGPSRRRRNGAGVLFTEDDDFPAYGVSLGPADEDNYRFLQFDATVAEPTWFFFGSLSGDSDAVRDGPGEFTDLTIGKDGEEIFLAAGDTELWRFTPTSDPSPNSLRRVSSIWLAGVGDGGSHSSSIGST